MTTRRWLKPTEICSPVLQAKSKGAGRITLPLRSLGEDPSLPLPASDGPHVPCLGATLLFHFLPLSSQGRLPSVSVSSHGGGGGCVGVCPVFPLIIIPVILIKGHSKDPIISNLIISAKTIFPD